MEIYVRAELPETCYIHEAALWIAFGVVPRFFAGDEPRDIRGVVSEHLEHMQAALEIDFYEGAPIIQNFLPGVDPQKFSDALFTTGTQDPEEISGRIANQERFLTLYSEEQEPSDEHEKMVV